MKRRLMILAAALVVFANAWILMAAWNNRRGEPTSTLVLTEREAPLMADGEDERESTGVALLLNWQGRFGFGEPLEWLDDSRLSELGFDLGFSATREGAERHYEAIRGIEAFIVLENDGPSYAGWQAAEDKRTERELEKWRLDGRSESSLQEYRAGREREVHGGSRLIPVDAGLDHAKLREAHPDQGKYLIVPGIVRVSLADGRVQGNISELRVDAVHVPRDLGAALIDVRRGGLSPWGYYGASKRNPAVTSPRYSVVIHWGRRFEPWVAEVRRVPEPE